MTTLRETAQQIFARTLAAIEVESVVQHHLQRNGEQLIAGKETIDLAAYHRVLVIAIGKASVPMARAAETVLGARLSGGLVVTNALTGAAPQKLPVVLGGHPIPNAGSLAAATQALQLLRENDSAETLVLFLLSGGGSALFEKPIAETISLDDLQTINRVLVGCGAVIGEMNVVRRFLSAVKGGRLAAAAPRARQLTLYISDVNSDDLTSVSSGPTLPGNATRAEFDRIVAHYDLLRQFPPHIAALVSAGDLPELPQPDETNHLHTHHLLLDNRKALLIARQIAERDFGCVVEIADDLVEGQIETMMFTHLERLQALQQTQPGKTVCLLSGGEVICPVRGNGQGGRNQEFVLRTAIHLHQQNWQNIVVLSAGTDGIDGHSPADGALADGDTLRRAMAQNISAEALLQNSDSYNFFLPLGDALITGPTGNNVRDIRILLAR